MLRNIKNSLPLKIIFTIISVSLLVMFILFVVLEKINENAFYKIEIDKANIILKTVEPLIALDLYLGMKDNINSITKELVNNPNILSIKITTKDNSIYSLSKNNHLKETKDYFIVTKDIYQPNSKKIIANMLLTYSSENYKKLRHEYRKTIISLFVALIFLFILLSLYIKRLLSPLRKIASHLNNYNPDIKHSPFICNENNEIGLIANELNNMQNKIQDYSEKQQNINKDLEKMIEKKTKELKTQLFTNTLTGLPNRISLVNDIISLEDGALIILNIDDFKEINDFFGHIVGDSVLIQLSKRLKYILNNRSDVKLIHLHADEFGLLFTKDIAYSSFMKMVKRIVKEIENIVLYHEDNKIVIQITIGAVYGIDNMLERADIALKLAKKTSKDYVLYDKKLNIEHLYEENLKWVKDIKNAIKKDTIIPFFQPIYDTKSKEILSCECLIRLIDKDNNIIAPYKFLTIAKKSRLYTQLTKIMIQKSCEYFQNFKYNFSMNLSIEDILDKDTVTFLKTQMQRYKVADRVVLEILETEGIENYEKISKFIADMKKIGCKIAIDDFGSGYANFEYILKLNIDYIKIDGTLIKNLDTDKNAKILVETIVDFAQRLNIQTIAEYVHNEAIYKEVKKLNIDRSQGFYLSEPVADIKELL